MSPVKSGEEAMSHRYIVSSTPYLVTTKPPIYKVPTRGMVVNPNKMKPGPLETLIQIGDIQNDMVNIIIEPPQEVADVEIATVDVESTQEQEGTIVITPIQDVDIIQPVKTRKIRVGNKVKIVPIESTP
tara:strand:+ start:140 stop:526 length:387 start_codon:yes stop_codon:yes gene_type:complete